MQICIVRQSRCLPGVLRQPEKASEYAPRAAESANLHLIICLRLDLLRVFV
jgi:hypothetical protein